MKEQEHLMRKSMMYHFEEKSFTNPIILQINTFCVRQKVTYVLLLAI